MGTLVEEIRKPENNRFLHTVKVQTPNAPDSRYMMTEPMDCPTLKQGIRDSRRYQVFKWGLNEDIEGDIGDKALGPFSRHSDYPGTMTDVIYAKCYEGNCKRAGWCGAITDFKSAVVKKYYH